MVFKTIKEIKDYFGLDSEDKDEIRKELIDKIRLIHPDKNNGEFKSVK